MNGTPEDREWRWRDLSEGERWKVWWGVTWRQIAVGIAFYLILLILLSLGLAFWG